VSFKYILSVAFLAALSVANAQQTTATLLGSVTDATGAAVAGVAIQAANLATNVQREALTIMIDREGRYYIDNNEVLNPSIESLSEAIERVAAGDHDRPVMLRADAMTPHQSVVTAMDALGRLGYTRLSIATTPTQASKSP